ncbi:MAG TPA: SDR family oxidoreductase [Pirellulaceae bacterium]
MTSASPVAIVSGGSRGLGRAFVSALLDDGYRVATFGRSDPPPGNFHPDQAGRYDYQRVDAGDAAATRQFVQGVLERWGRVDALVNNAAVAHDGVLALTTEEQVDQMLSVNLRATLLLTKECVRAMLVQRGGSIVSISSIIAERGFAGLSVYAATKAAMLGMTKSLARELGPRQIRVNAIAPGYVATEMSSSLSDAQRGQIERRTPLGRLASVEDIVPVLRFLLSENSRFITGQTFVVDGGASL